MDCNGISPLSTAQWFTSPSTRMRARGCIKSHDVKRGRSSLSSSSWRPFTHPRGRLHPSLETSLLSGIYNPASSADLLIYIFTLGADTPTPTGRAPRSYCFPSALTCLFLGVCYWDSRPRFIIYYRVSSARPRLPPLFRRLGDIYSGTVAQAAASILLRLHTTTIPHTISALFLSSVHDNVYQVSFAPSSFPSYPLFLCLVSWVVFNFAHWGFCDSLWR